MPASDQSSEITPDRRRGEEIGRTCPKIVRRTPTTSASNPPHFNLCRGIPLQNATGCSQGHATPPALRTRSPEEGRGEILAVDSYVEMFPLTRVGTSSGEREECERAVGSRRLAAGSSRTGMSATEDRCLGRRSESRGFDDLSPKLTTLRLALSTGGAR